MNSPFDQLMAGLSADPGAAQPPAVQKALQLARVLQQRASELQSPQERRQQAELERMMDSPRDKATMVQITDQAFRSHRPHREADQLVHILDVQGVPRFFSDIDRLMLKGFQTFGTYLPGVAVPLVKEKMREETANVVLPAERELLAGHLEARRANGLRMNVNFLGEALLGEDEARSRLKHYLQALQYPELEVMSVKISTIYSQIWPVAREHSIQVLCERMELLYRAAAKQRFVRADGDEVSKFVYLDMEEYRDMTITEEVFIRTLSRKGLEHVRAGIALQAYIPDSFLVQQRINAWARERVAKGGAPVTIRLVKGANLEMEQVEASLKDWPQAPYTAKADTDANYKRMLQEGLKPENIAAVKLGIASHNLFDVAYGLALAHECGALGEVQFEMLEGMANHQRRALSEVEDEILLYAPATRREHFIHAIGYLVRRLDENTGPENFLRHAFKLEVGSEDWRLLEQGFLDAFARIPDLPAGPRRTQDRRNEAPVDAFNEPDTDFALPHHFEWAEDIRAKWLGLHGADAMAIPLVVAGTAIVSGREIHDSLDPSRPGVVVARACVAADEDIECALQAAAGSGWPDTDSEARDRILHAAANALRRARANLVGAAMAECGKIFTESDPEVSEAVDFVTYYIRCAKDFRELDGAAASPIGPVVVVSPWNFPIAIPCGGVAAALAAGNPAILKPSPDAVMTAYLVCECFWEAGVPRDALQFLPTRDIPQASRLVCDERVAAVMLTGGTETATAMLRARPAMPLFAETGGKNATIVTAMSDRELAVKHVLHSAFGHSGQKCSATSLLILEEEVFRDETFKELLRDATESLHVGSAWEAHTRINPLIRPPSEKLETALKELEPGEEWLLMPQCDPDNPLLWSPGIKWNVQPGSFTHRTEFFGPVLGVMMARDLDEAIELANGTPFGLTAGLESLDDREQKQWLARMQAGNLYLNRETTGAIVNRQPFGGMKKSAFGPGTKAGGPDYVAMFMRFEAAPAASAAAIGHPELAALAAGLDLPELAHAFAGYAEAMDYFGAERNVALVGQDNISRYLPVRELRIRVHPDDSLFEIAARVGAARAAGCRMTVSVPPDSRDPGLERLEQLTLGWAAGIEFTEESDAELADAMRQGQTDRVRYAARDRVPPEVLQAVAETGLCVVDRPVLPVGRVELLWYVMEQCMSINYHRYGNLGERTE